MILCYMDESGTPETPNQSGVTSHFVLVGLAIPVWHWKTCDDEIASLKQKYSLENVEIHCAWMTRRYSQQNTIKNFVHNFDKLGYEARRKEIEKLQNRNRLTWPNKKQRDRIYPYIHLTVDERIDFLTKAAKTLSNWGHTRLFAECIDKHYFDPLRHKYTVAETAFDQVVTRFEKYLQITNINFQDTNIGRPNVNYGLLIHDNNPTVANRHTDLMRKFHRDGTLWTNIEHIIETPFFVDSQLTSMVQLADICSYALRRYLENNEKDLFKLVFKRADRKDNTAVGIRHFTNNNCSCLICKSHRTTPSNPSNFYI